MSGLLNLMLFVQCFSFNVLFEHHIYNYVRFQYNVCYVYISKLLFPLTARYAPFIRLCGPYTSLYETNTIA